MDRMFHVKHWKKDGGVYNLSDLNWESFREKMKNMDKMFYGKH